MNSGKLHIISFKEYIQALTAESYFDHYVEAIESATGFNASLIDRMVSLQINEIMENKGSGMDVTVHN
ncbi:MAG: hypothetical protein GQ581_08190 [Methyloprofundus sp.]|nr:hypothetical protein [Methyloprofundus sp.]